MKNNILIYLLAIVFLSSCGSTSPLKGIEFDLSEAYANGKYSEVFPVYKGIIQKYESRNKVAPDSIYAQAGISAFQLDSMDYAQRYLEKIAYKENADSEVLVYTARMYRGIDNLSKEIKFLELYLQKYPNGENKDDIKTRLFLTCIESENIDMGLKLWDDFNEEEKKHIKNVEGFIQINELAAKHDDATRAARQLLDSHPQNRVALEYLANRYYKKADKLYVTEMKAYQQNRTNKQYKVLLDALKTASSDFRAARNYYETLFSQEKKSFYASRLSKIYSRLDNEEKANYYKQFI